MMYKKITTIILVGIIFLMSITNIVYANGKGSDDGDILLLYDKNSSNEKEIGSISDILTYLGYKVSYSSIEDSVNKLDKFNNIIIYSEKENADDKFIQKLYKCNNKFMVIGNGLIKDIINYMDNSIEYVEEGKSEYEINYNFSNEKDISLYLKTDDTILLKGDFEYASGKIASVKYSGNYSVRSGNLSYIAVYDCDNDILKAMLTQEIALWMWQYKGLPHNYAQYIVLDGIYPFVDPEKLFNVIEIMNKYRIPYIISVMPIYINSEYPAMKKFCEILSYAQSNGWAIILHSPIIQREEVIEEEINEKINTSYLAYSQYKVYPIGLEAPKDWIYSKNGQNILRRFKTIFLYESSNEERNKNNFNNEIYNDGHNIVSPALMLNDKEFCPIRVHSTAVYLNINDSIEDIEETIDIIMKSNVLMKSMWDMDQSVYTNQYVLKYENKILKFQGKVVSLSYEPFKYEKNFDYKRNIVGRMARLMSNSNKVLLVFVGIISFIFIIFIIIARKNNKRSFFH